VTLAEARTTLRHRLDERVDGRQDAGGHEDLATVRLAAETRRQVGDSA